MLLQHGPTCPAAPRALCGGSLAHPPASVRGLDRSRRASHVRRQRCLQPRASLGFGDLLAEGTAAAAQSSGAPSSLDHLAAQLTTSLLTLGDVADATGAAAAGAAESLQSAAETVQKGSDNGGFFGFFTSIFEAVLKIIYDGLHALNVPYAYGFAIILLTFLVKALTFPLSKQQVTSTVAMQAIQPRVKEIQARYKGKPQEEMQIEVARLYRDAGINPLAGCLPTLATIPVWIGLYRAFSNAADEGLLTDGWFWIPSLAGPTTLAAQKAGTAGAWLFPFVNGAPPIGWEKAGAYLVLPALLIGSQYITQRIMTPPSDDPQQKTTQNILKFLPLMIGYFSLNVPSGLTLYWFTNNLLSTGQQYWLKKTTPAPVLPESTPTGFVPQRPPRGAGVVDTVANRVSDSPSSSSSSSLASSSSASNGAGPAGGSRGKKKGEKFRALQAKEAAKKAARQATAAAAAAVQTTAPASTVTDGKSAEQEVQAQVRAGKE